MRNNGLIMRLSKRDDWESIRYAANRELKFHPGGRRSSANSQRSSQMSQNSHLQEQKAKKSTRKAKSVQKQISDSSDDEKDPTVFATASSLMPQQVKHHDKEERIGGED